MAALPEHGTTVTSAIGDHGRRATATRLLDHPKGPTVLDRFAVRCFDIAGSVVLALFSAPLMAGLALLVKLTTRGPVFYGSERVGTSTETFRAWKFRTMAVDADDRLRLLLKADPASRDAYERYGKLLHDPRITPVGKWLRLLSLDELPQLWNVFIGDMSLVGPRPKLPHEQWLYGSSFAIVSRVKPGLTGLWQVSGRSRLTYDERIALDVTYVLSRTLRRDIAICFQTAAQMFRPDLSRSR